MEPVDGVPSFKGKGEIRSRMRDLALRQAGIDRRLRCLAQEFQTVFRSPRPAHLALHHHGGYLHLRWRASVRDNRAQTYFELLGSEAGRRLLDSVPPSVRTLLLQFERARLPLNLASSLTRHELRRLQAYLVRLDALRAQENRS